LLLRQEKISLNNVTTSFQRGGGSGGGHKNGEGPQKFSRKSKYNGGTSHKVLRMGEDPGSALEVGCEKKKSNIGGPNLGVVVVGPSRLPVVGSNLSSICVLGPRNQNKVSETGFLDGTLGAIKATVVLRGRGVRIPDAPRLIQGRVPQRPRDKATGFQSKKQKQEKVGATTDKKLVVRRAAEKNTPKTKVLNKAWGLFSLRWEKKKGLWRFEGERTDRT